MSYDDDVRKKSAVAEVSGMVFLALAFCFYSAQAPVCFSATSTSISFLLI